MKNLMLSITFGLIETVTNNDSWLVTLVFKLLGLGRVMFEYYHVFFFFQFCFDSKILYTPQQNNIAKHKNCNLLEVAHALCFTMGVPKFFWVESIMTTAFFINRMLAQIIDYETPSRKLYFFTL